MGETGKDDFQSYEQEIEAMTPRELKEALIRENRELGKLGVKIPVSTAVYGARTHGHNYEDRFVSEESDLSRITPINLLMSTIHNQPSLKDLPLKDFERLAHHVSRVAMMINCFIRKVDWYSLPASLENSPESVVE